VGRSVVLSNVRKQFETATLAQPTIWVCCFPEKIMPMIYQVPVFGGEEPLSRFCWVLDEVIVFGGVYLISP